jgi:hypothetical protein
MHFNNRLFYNSQIWRLQAALGEQTEVTKYSQEEYERLQNVKFSTLIAYHLTLQFLAVKMVSEFIHE